MKFVGPVHCSRDSQVPLFSNFFFKIGFHGTIHRFKNYFTTVFSVFSFQQNKWYPNTPLLQTKKEDTNYHFFSTFQA